MSKYSDLFPPQPEVEVEVVSGQFSCQEHGCDECVSEAKYIEEISVLTWICPKGHISKIEGFS